MFPIVDTFFVLTSAAVGFRGIGIQLFGASIRSPPLQHPHVTFPHREKYTVGMGEIVAVVEWISQPVTVFVVEVQVEEITSAASVPVARAVHSTNTRSVVEDDVHAEIVVVVVVGTTLQPLTTEVEVRQL